MVKEKKDELQLKCLNDVRCPQCNGIINQVLWSDYNYLSGNAVFLVECWSGDSTKESHYHLFLVRIPIEAEVNISSEEEKKA